MSGARVPYHLRQNKHVERELFAQLLKHVDKVRPIKTYLYIGFGGIFFEDFKTLYSAFETRNMVSIESEKWAHSRQLFNLPYGCIECRHLSSSDLVRDFAKLRKKYRAAGNVLCWLDYANPRQLRSQLEEFRALIPKLGNCDILKITLNANPATLWDRESEPGLPHAELLTRRLEKLRERVGDMLPEGIAKEELTSSKYPSVLLRMVQAAAAEASRELPKFDFQPLASYIYNDYRHTMLTVAGILLHSRDRLSFLNRTRLKEWEFAGTNWEVVKIDIPHLSPREKLALDRMLYKHTASQIRRKLRFQFDQKAAKSGEMVGQYEKYHRFYPHYHRIQY